MKHKVIFLSVLSVSFLLPSWGMASTAKKSYINLSKDGLQVQKSDIANEYNQITTKFSQVVYDFSGKKGIGTLIGNKQLENSKEDMGKAFAFNGTRNYPIIPFKDTEEAFNATEEVTYEAWVKPNTPGPILGRQQCDVAWPINEMSIGYGSTSDKFGLYYQLNYQNANTYTTFSVRDVIKKGEWTHIAASYSKKNGQILMYVNGNIVGSGTYDKTLYKMNTPFFIGGVDYLPDAACWKAYYNGQIDEIRVWNVARTPKQIKDNYERTLEGKQENLVGYWNFDE